MIERERTLYEREMDRVLYAPSETSSEIKEIKIRPRDDERHYIRSREDDCA
jgi:hypothetical protein